MAGHERMLARVLEYVSVAGGMELATADDVAKEEVRVAMESVFPLSTLVRFTTLPGEERQQQVESLARVTTGICLYNQTLGRGGSALPPGASSYLPQVRAGRAFWEATSHHFLIIHLLWPAEAMPESAAGSKHHLAVHARAGHPPAARH